MPASGVELGHGLFDARHQLRPLHADQIRQPLRPLQPRVHLVSLALLDGVLRPGLDVGLRPSHLLAYLRLRCVAVNGHDVWATIAGLVDLEILRALALDQQPLAIDVLAILVNAVLYLLLLYSTWASSLLCW